MVADDDNIFRLGVYHSGDCHDWGKFVIHLRRRRVGDCTAASHDLTLLQNDEKYDACRIDGLGKIRLNVREDISPTMSNLQ